MSPMMYILVARKEVNVPDQSETLQTNSRLLNISILRTPQIRILNPPRLLHSKGPLARLRHFTWRARRCRRGVARRRSTPIRQTISMGESLPVESRLLILSSKSALCRIFEGEDIGG